MVIAQNIKHQASTGPAKASSFASDLSSPSLEWQLVQRVAASPAFTRSTLLTNFLLYVCDRKLQGREDEITEFQIGVHALGRPANYHPGEDNIVRNYARILRKRLEEFFEDEGRREGMRIVIPRGHYVPIFEPVQRIENPVPNLSLTPKTASEEMQNVQAAEAEPPARQGINRRRFLISTSMAASLGFLGWLGFHETEGSRTERLFHRFWSQIFSPDRECFVVTGDSGLVLFERVTGQGITLSQYVNGTLASDFRELSFTSPSGKGSFDAGMLHFTSTADLKVAVALDRLAISSHATMKVRNARDMRMDELKNSNGVFIGGPRANPWIELFEPHSNFRMKFYPVDSPDHANQSIWNKRPKPDEQQEYLNSSNTSPSTTYTMVSFLPSLDDEGWVLLLEGQNLSGTGASGDFVTNMNAIVPVLKKAQKSDGGIGPFEVILETQAVGSDASKARIVAERYELIKS